MPTDEMKNIKAEPQYVLVRTELTIGPESITNSEVIARSVNRQLIDDEFIRRVTADLTELIDDPTGECMFDDVDLSDKDAVITAEFDDASKVQQQAVTWANRGYVIYRYFDGAPDVDQVVVTYQIISL
ncbi:hypothetical protein [Butyrivibrio sp.]|uniref:hypothetical protein n=1 Tax=Butyrivibrio sp. TaxID=28121 RepID=UPI0025B9A543|nr:hypothetical protein [Butyrivibrio sp.]MBQ7431348.1 hypothetical protein [Butyrivibrio sp.]MBQ9302711.1 hypothetical protein [Butyrivibrio sp.]